MHVDRFLPNRINGHKSSCLRARSSNFSLKTRKQPDITNWNKCHKESLRSWNSLIYSKNPLELTYYGLHISLEKNITVHGITETQNTSWVTPPANTWQDRKRTYQRNIEARLRNHCRRKKYCVKYAGCVFVALAIRHEKFMRYINCHLWPVCNHSTSLIIISWTARFSWKSHFTYNVCFEFISKFCPKHFSFYEGLREIW